MNNRGFTLIELIATIALLTIIAVISFVSINGVLEHEKVADCENLIGNIKSAASEYVSDNRYKSDFVSGVNNGMVIIKGDALGEDYLKGEVIDPFNKNTISLDTIEITIYLNKDYTARDVIVKGISCDR